jgi:hypothetical protein
MRDELLAYLKSQKLGTVSVTDELPYDKDGNALYLKNFKKIYVGKDNSSQSPLINTLDGGSIVEQVITTNVWLTLDAKTSLVNYHTIIALLRDARHIDNRFQDRTVDVSETYQGDAMVTEVKFSLKEIITI